jgi:hypothetical protein
MIETWGEPSAFKVAAWKKSGSERRARTSSGIGMVLLVRSRAKR